MNRSCPEFIALETFGGLQWSKDDLQIAYVAETKSSSSVTYEQFNHENDWGEGYSKKKTPVLIIAHLNRIKDIIQVVEMKECIGQPIFVPSGLVFAVFKKHPLRYGIKYCQNRPTELHLLQWTSQDFSSFKICRLSLDSHNVRSPRLSPCSQFIYYLSNKIGGPHASVNEIWRYDLHCQTLFCLVPAIQKPAIFNAFPGLYVDQLPKQCFLTLKETFLVCTSQWRSLKKILLIDIHSGKILVLPDMKRNGHISSVAVLAACKSYLVVYESDLLYPGALNFGIIHENIDNITWKVLSEPETIKGDSNLDLEI